MTPSMTGSMPRQMAARWRYNSMRRPLMLAAITALAVGGPNASAAASYESAVFLDCVGDVELKKGARLIKKSKKIRRVWVARNGSWIEIYNNGVIRYPRRKPTGDPVADSVPWSYDQRDAERKVKDKSVRLAAIQASLDSGTGV